MDYLRLQALCKRARKLIIESTSTAGSGHPTSCLSAVELMVGLMFNGSFRYRISEPTYHNNDRLIFSKGHAAPLLYSLWVLAGAMDEDELLRLRRFDSALEGHPSRRFPYTEAVTGSLGQGLSVGVGMALNAKYLDNLTYRTFVLLGDGEMAEGQIYEAMQLAGHYKLNNLIAVVDVNRLEQVGKTMLGWDMKAYARRAEAFGWDAIMLDDGHELSLVEKAYEMALMSKEKPVMIIARTKKGKGISFLEDVEGWHGKALDRTAMRAALEELGEVDNNVTGDVGEPDDVGLMEDRFEEVAELGYDHDEREIAAPREAYGHVLVKMGLEQKKMVVLDAGVGNSTHARQFAQYFPKRFFEMYIAEQNMVSTATGLALRGKQVFVSTFGAFFTRAVDQLRVAAYCGADLKLVGSHVGVSIGEDGPTQMGLEDIALFRSILGSAVLQPADHVSTEKLAMAMLEYQGICYMRTVRMDLESLYDPKEEFWIGGSKTLRSSTDDVVTLIGSGVTVHECLRAYNQLIKEGVVVRVIDLYSIKPLDVETVVRACKETRALIVVEDHYAEGGIAEAVRSQTIFETTPVHSLAVTKMPRSGKPHELMAWEGIDAEGIVRKVREILQTLQS